VSSTVARISFFIDALHPLKPVAEGHDKRYGWKINGGSGRIGGVALSRTVQI
jgi:hypothetical protein